VRFREADGEVPAAGESRQTVIALSGAETRAVSLWSHEMYPIQAGLDDYKPTICPDIPCEACNCSSGGPELAVQGSTMENKDAN
jgi:hypothetical protein